jgi:diguanylate cyclase (GGDEF)-like protein/PAS domain S-box-containing protein
MKMAEVSILIVEDESLIARDIKLSLEGLGYGVVDIASSGEEAIQKTRELNPSLVLMDIMLKGDMDGIEAAEVIHRELDIPVVFLTAHSNDSIVERAKAANPYGYLLKPFKEKELVVTLEMSFRRHFLEKKLKQNEKKLRESEAKFRTIFEASPIGIELYDTDGNLLNANSACLEIYGVSDMEEIRRLNLFEDPNISAATKERLQRGEIMHYDTLLDFNWIKEQNLFNTSRSGIRYLDVLITPMGDKHQESINGYLVQFQDVTQRKQDEILLRELTIVDELTGLYNRRGFLTVAHQQMNIAKRLNKSMLLFFIDMDNLKSVNDNFSHKEGDNALISSATILNDTFRSSDIIARWGGDEFIVLMVNIENVKESIIENRLQESIDRYNETKKLKFNLSLSWGIVTYNHEENINLEELIIRADKLMYKHKRRKRREGGQ